MSFKVSGLDKLNDLHKIPSVVCARTRTEPTFLRSGQHPSSFWLITDVWNLAACCVKCLGQCVVSGKQEQKKQDSSCAEACLLTYCHNWGYNNFLLLMVESGTAALLTDCQPLAAVQSILLLKPPVPYFTKLPAKKRNSSALACSVFAQDLFIIKIYFYFIKTDFSLISFPALMGKKRTGGEAITYHFISVTSYSFRESSSLCVKPLKSWKAIPCVPLHYFGELTIMASDHGIS